jgi:hypothetical protein
MAGFVVHVGATVLCAHGGQAQPTVPFPRVQVSGMPVTTVASPYAIAGCPFVAPAGNGPCVMGQWLVGSTRVLAGGMPLVLQAGASICMPTATPMLVLVTQTRVTAL